MYHESVLLQNIIGELALKNLGVYVDATLGGGGVSFEIIDSLEKGSVICLDVDIDAIDNFEKEIYKRYKVKVVNGKCKLKNINVYLYNKNFSELKEVLKDLNINYVNGIVYDLGVSSFQIDNPSKGFSYIKDSPLDMRMDKNLKVTARDLLNGLYEKELYELFKNYSEDPFSKSIARNIVLSRKIKKIEKSSELVEIIRKSVKGQAHLYHHVSRIFQALRIKVNNELGVLKDSLLQLPDILDIGGRVIFITFHSGEDRIVKQYFLSNSDKFLSLYKKPILPDQSEIEKNRRARSSKMRIYEKK